MDRSNPEELKDAKHIYPGMIGWDEDSVIPRTARLQEVDIDWAADQLR